MSASTSNWPPAAYYLRTKSGEPLMGYPDIYEGRKALATMPVGTELVRAEDGAVVSVMYSSTIPVFTFNMKRRRK